LLGLLDRPSAGRFQFLGHDVASWSENELARVRAQSLGFIFQSFNLLPYLTALQNVELPLLYHSGTKPSKNGRALLTEMNLAHRENAYPGTLSGGERQRVAIARALIRQPALLLADEPTGALDSKSGMHILDILTQLHKAGTTIVLVTHDETIARRAQRTLFMKDGEIQRVS
jgi:putative ABC transport system ATP-binding protein